MIGGRFASVNRDRFPPCRRRRAASERASDERRGDLELDPAEVRRRNLVRPEEFPYTSATGNVYDSGSYHAALARLLDVAAYVMLTDQPITPERVVRALRHAR